MKDKDSGTPRVFLVRHGQTEWSQNGRYTGNTELGLTAEGRQQVLGSAQVVVGTGNLIDPAKLAHVFISPRQRAQQTSHLLFGETLSQASADKVQVTTTSELAEWDYGAYEGLTTQEIHALRREHGLDSQRQWDIWEDGCEDGESADAVTARLDTLISKIRDLQGPNMHGERPCDVVLISHGHLLRGFIKRWLRFPLHMPLSLMLEPGGIGVLSYQHHNIQEPALMVGMAFPLKPHS
ncbi:MAG: hypothetical protein L6R42_000666 [Xanthoria sp. 1 TBL-2021]|nr:MAG: hypothetical protein L6R42_000666 [Xanthoria sp. 1 TBL-2021]